MMTNRQPIITGGMMTPKPVFSRITRLLAVVVPIVLITAMATIASPMQILGLLGLCLCGTSWIAMYLPYRLSVHRVHASEQRVSRAMEAMIQLTPLFFRRSDPVMVDFPGIGVDVDAASEPTRHSTRNETEPPDLPPMFLPSFN